MNKKYSITCWLFVALVCLKAQPTLKPYIGFDSLPAPSELICDIPEYLGSFYDSGLLAGDTVPDFQLFSPDGNAFHLAEALTIGKPVLLVNGNYTCPVFRGKVPVLNELVQDFGNQVTICVIYTLEAHPQTDISPYFGYVNTGSPNLNAGILYRQPTTYGERLDIVQDMLDEMDIQAPVYVDGPCNPWWTVFGPAPNNAYLISPDGVVVAKHGWFDRSPDDMACDLENYLNGPGTCGGTTGGNGSFTLNFVGDTIAYGAPGETLYVEAMLENPSADPVDIEIKRLVESVPAGWTTSMCIDICYATSVETTTIQVPAGASQLFIMDFFTNPDVEGTGMVQMGFRNVAHPNNKYVRRMYASTGSASGLLEVSGLPERLSAYPSPAAANSWVEIPANWLAGAAEIWLQLFDLNGKKIRQVPVNETLILLSRGQLPAGMYSYKVLEANKVLGGGKVVFGD